MTDNRTLDEVYKDDTEMTVHKIEREGKRFEFQTYTQARMFQRELINIAIKRMGVPAMHRLKLERQVISEKPIEMAQIRVENRTYPQYEAWKKGVYIYRLNADGSHGEVAYFVSDVFSLKENPVLRSANVLGLPGARHLDNTSNYYIMSTVPVDELSSKHFLMPMVG
jgi:hypothetical protein